MKQITVKPLFNPAIPIWIKGACLIATTALMVASANRCAADTDPMVVPTIADLRAVNVSSLTNDAVALVIDYYGPTAVANPYISLRGRGGGFFRWRTTSSLGSPTPVDDGGRWISPNTNTSPAGIWERMLQGETANVKMWGAKGDGTSVDYQAIQNAINSCPTWSVGELLFPQGTYIVTNTLVFNGSFLHIRGEAVSTTVVQMRTNIQADIFQSLNAYQGLHGLSFDFDHGLVFENLSLIFDGTETTRNTNNACLVVCQPGEANSIRNVFTQNGGFGIRCLGVGAPGLRLRDVTTMMPAVAGVEFDPVPGNESYTSDGGNASLIGVSGDQRWDSSAPYASLIRMSNTAPVLSISSLKVEGDFGGGVIQSIKPVDSSDIGSIAIREVTYNAGVTFGGHWYPPSLVTLRAMPGTPTPTVCTPTLIIEQASMNSVSTLINDVVTGRSIDADTQIYDGLQQTTAMLPMHYHSFANYVTNVTSRLVIGQTAYATFYPTNSGWYRVAVPLGLGSRHFSGNIVLGVPGFESTEFEYDVNPYAGTNGVWISVIRSTANNTWQPPIVTQARAFYYWGTSLIGGIDIYVGNPFDLSTLYRPQEGRMTVTANLNGYQVFDRNEIPLCGVILPVSATLPTGSVWTQVNTYR